jgi:hypothetical protein
LREGGAGRLTAAVILAATAVTAGPRPAGADGFRNPFQGAAAIAQGNAFTAQREPLPLRSSARRISAANLSSAGFDGANLSFTNLSLTDLRNTTFNHVDLSHANLNGANVGGSGVVVFDRAILDFADPPQR